MYKRKQKKKNFSRINVERFSEKEIEALMKEFDEFLEKETESLRKEYQELQNKLNIKRERKISICTEAVINIIKQLPTSEQKFVIELIKR